MSTIIRAARYHDFCYGHRVYGHESMCKHLHGHNGRVYFHCEADQLDEVGRVIDFSVIKARLCAWIEEHWDHRFLLYAADPAAEAMRAVDPEGVVTVPFNPTAENIAEFLLNVVGPAQLAGTGVRVSKVELYETRKCSATAELSVAPVATALRPLALSA